MEGPPKAFLHIGAHSIRMTEMEELQCQLRSNEIKKVELGIFCWGYVPILGLVPSFALNCNSVELDELKKIHS